ncbi:MAG: hypothetical protein UT90_C0020G0025 [Parcubacteria group bacterium GW2011_GWA1_40_21]|nr:MAG: hypothetical protein UT90_C0020G0025 [Parcubacteria group bacterium GW2011_GWA1_40_21]
MGSYKDISDTSTDYKWECVGSNGGSTASCSYPKLINGSCGSAKNVCDAGSFSDIVDSDTSFRWQCMGVNGGSSASCSSSLMTTPTNFRAVGAGCEMVNGKNAGVIGLTWNLLDKADRYEIKRLGSTVGSIRAVINLKGDQSNYVDKFGTGSNIYQGYELRACNNTIGCSPFSDKILVRSPNCQ